VRWCCSAGRAPLHRRGGLESATVVPRRDRSLRAPRPRLRPRAGTSTCPDSHPRGGDADLGFRPFLSGGRGSAWWPDLLVPHPLLLLLRLMAPPQGPLSLHLPFAQVDRHCCLRRFPDVGPPVWRPSQAPAVAVLAQRLLHGCPLAQLSGRPPLVAAVAAAGRSRLVLAVLCTALCSCVIVPPCSVCLLAPSR
jgi:hypothetical protein